MQIKPTGIQGVRLITSEKRGDDRGYLVRCYCQQRFEDAGLNTQWIQSSITSTPLPQTLRGMHFQTAPFAEIKLIRCISGSVWDCIIDIRPDSQTYGRWEAFELSEDNDRSLYLPEGIAHGFYTLSPDVRMQYFMSAPYSAENASGIRWNDPEVGIQWPGIPRIISERDQSWPALSSQ